MDDKTKIKKALLIGAAAAGGYLIGGPLGVALVAVGVCLFEK